MKTFVNVSIPVILTITLVLLLNTGSSTIYGQIIGQTNQTNQTSGGQNTTQQQATTTIANKTTVPFNQTTIGADNSTG